MKSKIKNYKLIITIHTITRKEPYDELVILSILNTANLNEKVAVTLKLYTTDYRTAKLKDITKL